MGMMLGEKTRRDIDALFADYDSPSSPGCALGVFQGGELAYARGYGMADLEARVPVGTGTVFHLASVSKQFTAAAVALLEEAGELSLDDEVGEYLDWLPAYCRPLTLRHLVSMTNGLEDIYDVASLVMGIPEDSYFTMEEAVAIIQSAKGLLFAPGEKWSYGNTGYFLLARIVERASGLSFAEFARSNIFGPLGMRHSFVRSDRRQVIPHVAKTYSRLSQIRFKEPEAASLAGWGGSPELMELSGAGQVWSTVEDLALWERNYYSNVLGKGKPDFMRRLSRPFRLNDGTPTRYAYGQMLCERHGSSVVYHEGGSPGINTVIYRVPEKGLSVICLANSSDFLTTLLRGMGEEVYERIADLALGWGPAEKARGEDPRPSEPPRAARGKGQSPAAAGGLEEYAGLYRCERLDTAYRVEPRPEGIELRNEVPGRDFRDLLFSRESGELFVAAYPPALDRFELRFVRGADGRVASFAFPDEGSGREAWAFERKRGA